MYNLIASGSKSGNAVIYHGSILVDCGIPAALLKEYVRDISIVLLTHEHSDHFNLSTLRWLQGERPSIRVGCCDWMLPHLTGVRNIDIYEVGKAYDYGVFSLVPIFLYHDVKNCGYRIFKGNYKIIHATDTAHLDGITAKGYDLYAIEHNYDEETIGERIAEKRERDQYSYEREAIKSHLSEQQARDFIIKNKGEKYEVLRLHESGSFL